jgi:hypothetical protein
MQLVESKSLLAKLMATENLIIEHRNVDTAMFDVKSRVLTVPVLDNNISSYTYDLFMGHEVGHALYTPLEGMYKAKAEKINRSIVNIVEDARIERLIKYKYPGLRNSFTKAYKELVEKNFFGTQGVDLNTLNFADRINMHFKGGAAQAIKFSEEERELVREIDRTESYDEVLEVSKKIVALMKLQEEERKRKAKLQPQEELGENDSGDSDGNPNMDDEWDENDSETEVYDESEQDGASDNKLEKDDKNVPAADQQPNQSYDDDIKSFTDESYKQNEKQLFVDEKRKFAYANIPNINLNEMILDHKVLWKMYKDDGFEARIDLPGYQKLRTETNKVVSYLVKEFELRKNADQMKRATTAKTGELDMSKVFSYKFSEDIFKKISVVPNGKSHGLVLFLDWSGSMSGHIENTIKQLLALVLFCKKVNIPYEVYAFAQPSNYSEFDICFKPTPKENDLVVNYCRMFNFLSSRMSASEFTYACSALMMTGRRRSGPYWMELSGTPLNEAIISAMYIVPEFQKNNNLQIVNTVFLTDGDGHPLRSTFQEFEEYGTKKLYPTNVVSGYSNDVLIVRDPITKHEERIGNTGRYDDCTSAYIKLLKARTGCNVLGFYVISGREFNRKLNVWFPKVSASVRDEMVIKFRKEKSLVVTTAGFDEYYVLRSEALDTESESEFVVKENATTRGLVNAFSKYTKGRVANRVVLNRFIELVS